MSIAIQFSFFLTLEGGKCLNRPSILIPVATPIVCPPTPDPKEIALWISMALVTDGEIRGIGLRE